MNVYLVVKRRSLQELPWLWRWLIRAVYFRTGWASDFSLEYQGVFTEESEARWAAGGAGMSYTELPLNTSLPEECVQYGTHDFPMSEASELYRRRALPTVAVPRELMDQALAVSRQLEICAQGKCRTLDSFAST